MKSYILSLELCFSLFFEFKMVKMHLQGVLFYFWKGAGFGAEKVLEFSRTSLPRKQNVENTNVA